MYICLNLYILYVDIQLPANVMYFPFNIKCFQVLVTVTCHNAESHLRMMWIDSMQVCFQDHI